MSSTFWDSIRHLSGWGWALGEIKRNPRIIDARGPRWGETALHWAALGNLEATETLCQSNPHLLSILDAHDRSPLDWVVEKMFFLRQAQAGELDEERRRSESLLAPARACALFILGWISAHGPQNVWSGDPVRFVQVALAAGELEVAIMGESVGGRRHGVEIWLGGLAAFWHSRKAVEAYLDHLASSHAITGESVVFGRPLGLHVAHLWATGAIDAVRAQWFHESGARLDQETASESIETFCSADGAAGAARLDALIKQIGC